MEELNTVELDYYMTLSVIAVEESCWNHNYFCYPNKNNKTNLFSVHYSILINIYIFIYMLSKQIYHSYLLSDKL